MQRLACLPVILTAALLITTTAKAETPNLMPGLWSYTSTTSIQGPMTFSPQSNTQQQCVTPDDLDKGIEVIDMPQDCTITRADVLRDRVDYAARCNMQGMNADFEGYATFHGDRIEGQMSSDMDTPMGKMVMQMDYKAQRIDDC